MGKVELLAPAGTMECFTAALNAGADAVYIGGQRFGARAFAGNFSDDEVLLAIRLAHFWNRKVYLTVNTLLKEEELAEVVPYLTPFYKAGLDGVIIQDMGVLKICRENFPGLALHASTQMTVTEAGAAKLLKELGIERVVPARELSLAEIRQLKEESGLEIETFIHGALCYAYSGQCLFSSFLGGRSGNRGRCAQPCRQPYKCNLDIKKGDERYPLSLKDLCVLQILPELIRAGIDSFKIEGRMKSPEYVAGVTSVYRKYIDLYEKNPGGWHVEKKDLDLLSKLYVRSGLEQGYYERHNGKEMVTINKPGYIGCPDEVLELIRKEIIDKQLQRPVELVMSLTADCPSVLTASTVLEDGTYLEVFSEGINVSPAHKRPLTVADVEKQLKKTGGSAFVPRNIEVYLNGDVFMPVGAINDLRRQTLDKLTDHICVHYASDSGRESVAPADVSESSYKEMCGCKQEISSDKGVALHVYTLFREQAVTAVKIDAIRRVYVSSDAVLSGQEAGEDLFSLVQKRKEKDPGFSFFLALPSILRSYSETYLKKIDRIIQQYDQLIDGICAASVSGIAAVHRFEWNKDIAISSGVYSWNKESLVEYDKMGRIVTFSAPLELNRANLFKLPKNRMELMIYGRIPMMISAGCVRKTSGECQIRHNPDSLKNGLDRCFFDTVLTDRYQVGFPVLANCMHCMNTIYNSVPLSLHNYMEEINASGIQAVRLDFTDEKPSDINKIIDFFVSGENNPITSFTTGHYKKGAQ